MRGIVHAHTGTQFKNLNIAKTTTTKTSGGVIGIILLNKHAFENTHVLISSPKAMIKCPYKSYLAEAGFHITLQFGRAAHGGREVKVAGIHTSWPHLICNQKAESDRVMWASVQLAFSILFSQNPKPGALLPTFGTLGWDFPPQLT